MKGDRLYFTHISECIERLERFTHEGREAFLGSDLVQAAVLRTLQTMAESVKRLSNAVKAAHPDVAWGEIAGLRNVLVHDYLDIDLEQIWDMVAIDLPVFKRQITAIMEALQPL